MKNKIISILLTLCMLIGFMPVFTVTADAAGETVYPYYVITKGATETSYYYVYKADSGDSFSPFTISADAEYDTDHYTAYSSAWKAIAAIDAATSAGTGSATLHFGATGTSSSTVTGILDIGSDGNYPELYSGTYTLKGSLSSSFEWEVLHLEGASVIVDGAFIEGTNDDGTITNVGSGDITVNSGTVQNTDASGGRAINNYGAGNVTVNGGRIYSVNREAIYSYGTGTVSISGSEWDGEAGTLVSSDCSDMEAILANGPVAISGGTVSAKYIAVEAHSGVNISGGRIESEDDTAIYNLDTGSITVSGGTIESEDDNAIKNDSTGNITVSGGKVYSSENTAINNYGTGTVTISGNEWNETAGTGTLVKSDSSDSAAIESENSPVVIEGGTILAEDTAVEARGVDISDGWIESKDGVAIYNPDTGSITVSGGRIEAENGAAIYNLDEGNITVSGGKVYSSGNTAAIFNIGSGTVTVSGSAWNETDETGTLVSSDGLNHAAAI